MLALIMIEERFELALYLALRCGVIIPCIDKIAEIVCIVKAADETSPCTYVVDDA